MATLFLFMFLLVEGLAVARIGWWGVAGAAWGLLGLLAEIAGAFF